MPRLAWLGPAAKACLVEMALQAKVGPILVSGTVTAASRREIWDNTQRSAVVRASNNRDRSVAMPGPVAQLEEAHKLAMDAMGKQAET